MEFLKSFLYYVVIFLIGLYILLVAFSPEKMMDVVGFRTFIVLSNSMEPKLNVNDMIISRSVNKDDLEVGDIITFEVYIDEIGEEVFVTHYLGAIEEDGTDTYYETRRYGLDDDEFDEWVDDDGEPTIIRFSDIEGTYLLKIPYVGYIQQTLSNKILLGLLLLNGGIIYLLVGMFKKKDEDVEETIIDD